MTANKDFFKDGLRALAKNRDFRYRQFKHDFFMCERCILYG